MICSVSPYSRSFQTQKLQNNNNRGALAPQRNNSSPNFKGGVSLVAALSSLVTYTMADYLSIVVGCSNVDGFFRHLNLRDARDFGVRVVKRKYKPEFEEISHITAHAVKELKENPKTQKAGKKLQNAYETIFQNKLKIDPNKDAPKGTTAEKLDAIYDKTESLFVDMGDVSRFTEIGKPIMKRVAVAQKALQKAGTNPIS